MSTILILEDEPFIALDLEETLVESGHQDHVTLSTCKDASAWLDAHTPAAAIIDPRLSDGICTTVVRRLSDLGVPFVVYSGEPDSLIENEPVFGKGEMLGKPASPDQVSAALSRALQTE
ncbi:response regulator [Rhizobium sp. BK376]|uniref:response regulator n=1 Tax=Rhizobium sp. BK376 TaxID=2512149 RepID=UPI000DDF9A0F|nr:response regulator [Rhizobium sp. BK376]TCR78678.1 response regulator receiver domain-containing protein [Rhizobium sp. BK376]